MKLIYAVIVAIGLVGIASAQDPTKVAPDSYKLQFENDWVKVLRVKYAPHAKVPVHDHSRFPAAYIYLSDSGPIKFIHADWDDPVLERPATKARSFRLSPTTQTNERHEVENPGDLASEFLRMEFKKLKQGQDLPHRRVPAAVLPNDKAFEKVEFESELIRITRLGIVEGKPLEIRAEKTAPTMIVVLAVPKMEFKSKPPDYFVGQVVWIEPGTMKTFAHSGKEPMELLRFDLLKTSQPN